MPPDRRMRSSGKIARWNRGIHGRVGLAVARCRVISLDERACALGTDVTPSMPSAEPAEPLYTKTNTMPGIPIGHDAAGRRRICRAGWRIRAAESYLPEFAGRFVIVSADSFIDWTDSSLPSWTWRRACLRCFQPHEWRAVMRAKRLVAIPVRRSRPKSHNETASGEPR